MEDHLEHHKERMGVHTVRRTFWNEDENVLERGHPGTTQRTFWEEDENILECSRMMHSTFRKEDGNILE